MNKESLSLLTVSLYVSDISVFFLGLAHVKEQLDDIDTASTLDPLMDNALHLKFKRESGEKTDQL